MDESIDFPVENTRYSLSAQTPRSDKPPMDVPIPDSNKYDSVAEKYIDGVAIDKLLREARYLLYLYHDINMSPEYRIVVQSLKNWREILSYSNECDASYWLREINKVLKRRA